jgi:predicted GIY-YIG superfamily endonuclease
MPLDVNWTTCQKLSNVILAEGLFALCRQEALEPEQVVSNKPGNYMISLENELFYVGEAKNLAARIRQQFAVKISTFYKTYAKRASILAPIDAFRVRIVETTIGRKELEEFAIVNAACSLNKFRRGKRDAVGGATSTDYWSEIQRRYATIIAQGEAAVLSEPFRQWVQASAKACAGIYVARAPKQDHILYLGESSNVHKRHKCHGGRTYFSALRRHVGTDVFGFVLKERNGKAKYFTEAEDCKVSEFLRACSIACMPVSFGRYELEEHLIRKFHPQLNRKDNEVEARDM